MAGSWELEEDDEQDQGVGQGQEVKQDQVAEREQPQTKPDYKTKAHIALEDSDNQTWGIARDTEGSFIWKSGEGPIVGTWSLSPVDGLIHVFLETPLMALVDKATLRFAEYAEKRKASVPAPRTRAQKAPKPAPEPDENQVKIDRVRKLLGRR